VLGVEHAFGELLPALVRRCDELHENGGGLDDVRAGLAEEGEGLLEAASVGPWRSFWARRYRRTRRAAASRGGCPSTADDEKKRLPTPLHFQFIAQGGLATSPGSCRIIAGSGQNLRKWES